MLTFKRTVPAIDTNSSQQPVVRKLEQGAEVPKAIAIAQTNTFAVTCRWIQKCCAPPRGELCDAFLTRNGVGLER